MAKSVCNECKACNVGGGRVGGRRVGGCCSIIQGRQPQEVSAAATRSASPALLFSRPNLTAAPSHTYLLPTPHLIQGGFSLKKYRQVNLGGVRCN